MKRIVFILICLFSIREQAVALNLSSSAFQPNGLIPSQYTCDGSNVSPPLVWAGIPGDAQSLVLIMDDPDVPKNIRTDGMWDHWVLFNIPTSVTDLSENAKDFSGAIHGKNSSGKLGYTGPCPPDRQHRYFFKIYALDTSLNLPEGATKAEVETACQGHILDQAVLMGIYDRPGRVK